MRKGSLKYIFGQRGEISAGSRVQRVKIERAAAFPIMAGPGVDEVLIQVVPFADEGRSELRTLNVKSGRTDRIAGSPVRYGSFVIDHQRKVRMVRGGSTFDESKVYVRVDDDWTLYEDANVSRRLLKPLGFAEDNQHLYALTTRDKLPDQLLRINLVDRSETVLHADAQFDPGWRELVAIPRFDRKDLAGILMGGPEPHIHWLDDKSAEASLVRAMAPQLPGHLVLPISASEDGTRVLLLAASDRNDGDFYLYDRSTKNASMVMSRREWLAIESLRPMEAIKFTARDGLPLHGFLTMPNAGSNPPPLVVLVHGGPYEVVDEWGFDPLVQALATRGHAVLQVNFRGSGGYGYDFTAAGYGQWGRTMQDDVTDATRALIESKRIDGERVAIYGASYGGYAALMGAVREPDLYRCAISYVGVSDLPLLTRGETDDTVFGRSFLKYTLGDDEDQLRAYSPSRQADQIKARVMLIHGAKDERVPLKHAELMRDALKAAGQEPEWYVERDEEHGFAKPEANAQLYQRVNDFLGECL